VLVEVVALVAKTQTLRALSHVAPAMSCAQSLST
jgi:hypothetical protein